MKQGDEAYEEPRLRGFALESWSYNYDLTRTLPSPKSVGSFLPRVLLPCQNYGSVITRGSRMT